MAGTELIYQVDSYVSTFEATVTAVDGERLTLDRTAFYPGGGGQPCDEGLLSSDGFDYWVVAVDKADGEVWHTVPGHRLVPECHVVGTLDWARRYELMQTHTGMHVLCAVIGNEWGVPVTGGNMDRLSARMDFAFDAMPAGFRERVVELVNDELRRDRAVRVSFVEPEELRRDSRLLRTQENLVPEGLTAVRVVEIEGLDRQADGGTHVAKTAEVGPMSITKLESKGKSYKRLRVAFERL